MWFEKLTGFVEKNPNQVRENLTLDGEYLISKINGKRYKYGRLEISTLSELKATSPILSDYSGQLTLSEVVGNIQDFHCVSGNNGALFQAASQFNLLEMVSPNVTPEQGIGIYEHDYTQGPACAIACGAGTIFRNYFVKINGQIGQTANNQVDCLDEIGSALGNENNLLWTMQNGYALATKEGLQNITKVIKALSPQGYEALKDKLKIGIQWNTEVTIANNQAVTQVYCSALPVAYSSLHADLWEVFARLILEATYEATFYTALKNFTQTGNARVFLTLVGGGAFGNRTEWIFDGINKAMDKFKNTPLDVKMVSYGRSDSEVQAFINRFNDPKK
jgi:hypothetical protein